MHTVERIRARAGALVNKDTESAFSCNIYAFPLTLYTTLIGRQATQNLELGKMSLLPSFWIELQLHL